MSRTVKTLGVAVLFTLSLLVGGCGLFDSNGGGGDDGGDDGDNASTVTHVDRYQV